MENITLNSLNEHLRNYRAKKVAEYYTGHRDMRLGKTVLGISDISEAYFCEKKVELAYKDKEKAVNAIDKMLIDGPGDDSYLFSLNFNDCFIFGSLPEPNELEMSGNVLTLSINTYHELTNHNFVNNHDEVYARTICYCIDSMIKEFKLIPVIIQYRLRYFNGTHKELLNTVRPFDLTTRVKARNDIEFAVDYWIQKRAVIKSSVKAKHEMCIFKNECGYGVVSSEQE